MDTALQPKDLAAVRTVLFKAVHKRHVVEHCVDFNTIWPYMYKQKHSSGRCLRRMLQNTPELKEHVVQKKGSAANHYAKKYFMTVHGLQCFLRTRHTARSKQFLQVLEDTLNRKDKIDNMQSKPKIQTTLPIVATTALPAKNLPVVESLTHSHHQREKEKIELEHLRRMKNLEFIQACSKLQGVQGVPTLTMKENGELTATATAELKNTDAEISIQSVCNSINVPYVPDMAATVGKEMAFRYRKKYNQDPHKRDVLFKGKLIRENAYLEKDKDMMIACIQDIMDVGHMSDTFAS